VDVTPADKYRQWSASKIEYPGGPLAQLVEQLTLNQRAVGSTPTRPTKKQSLTYSASSTTLPTVLKLCYFRAAVQNLYSIPQTFRIVVRVALRHDGRLVPEQLLHLVEINTRLHESRRERVSEIVKMKFLDLCLAQCECERPVAGGPTPSA
jgi:hypothetical protein